MSKTRKDATVEHINAKVVAAHWAGQPVISVDTKKKELAGNYKNGGTDYRPKGCPQRVKVHDFEDKELGKVVPCGVYDAGANTGWVVLAEPSSAWTSGSPRTRPSSRWPRSAGGTSRWEPNATRKRANSRSRQTAVAPRRCSPGASVMLRCQAGASPVHGRSRPMVPEVTARSGGRGEFPCALHTLIAETGMVQAAGTEVVSSLVSRIRG